MVFRRLLMRPNLIYSSILRPNFISWSFLCTSEQFFSVFLVFKVALPTHRPHRHTDTPTSWPHRPHRHTDTPTSWPHRHTDTPATPTHRPHRHTDTPTSWPHRPHRHTDTPATPTHRHPGHTDLTDINAKIHASIGCVALRKADSLFHNFPWHDDSHRIFQPPTAFPLVIFDYNGGICCFFFFIGANAQNHRVGA